MTGVKKCIFLEMPKGGLKMAEANLKVAAERPDLSDIDRKKVAAFSLYYPAIVAAAEKNGMQFFEIGHPDHLTIDKNEDERNEAMARNSTQLLSDSCESAIFFVGKAHISPLENRMSVVDIIRLRGIKPITYNLF